MMKHKIHTIGSTRNEEGFAILAVMGLLIALTVAITILLPNGITSHDFHDTDTERNNLHAIGEGTKLYLQSNRAWAPTLAAHNPGYVPFATTQLSQNDRLFPRYYVAHPNTSAFTNGTGLAESDLRDVRFLVVSNLGADTNPNITNAAEFENWWTTDESATPDLHIYRGNLASQFHQVMLKALDDGGSYQIDGTTTNSGGGPLADYSRYHVAGTVVGLDEDDTYGTPEVQFSLTGNVAYEYNPLCDDGLRWRIIPGPLCTPSMMLWITTVGNVSSSGAPGLNAWDDAEVLQFADPNLTFEPGTTDGTFSSIVNFDTFTQDGDVNIVGIHYVTKAITVGNTTTIDLFVGDLLFAPYEDETFISTNTLAVSRDDVVLFRPDNPGDYSAGTFTKLFDKPDRRIWGLTLVEADTVVGDVTLLAGTFLFAEHGSNQNHIIWHFTPDEVGESTNGTISELIAGQDINIDNGSNNNFKGVELIENAEGTTLQPGHILTTLEVDDNSTGDNSIATKQQDIFYLDVTTTGLGTTVANAFPFFEGADVNLNTTAEDIDGLTVVPIFTYIPLPIVNPGFETGDLTGWTKTGDLTGNGGHNGWGARTSTGAMSYPHGGTYFGSARADDLVTGGLFHEIGVYQRLNLSASVTEIDAGKVTASFSGFGHGETPGGCCDDKAKLRITFYDAVSGGSPIGAPYDSVWANTTEQWDPLFIYHAPVPVGARSIELLLLGRKEIGGTKLDGGIDDVRGTLTIAP